MISSYNARIRSNWGVILALTACLGLFVSFVSSSWHPRFEHRLEVVENQLALLSGQPYHLDGAVVEFPEFRSRLLFPLLLRGTISLGPFSASQVFLLLQLMTCWLAFLAFFLLLMKKAGASLKGAAFGSLAFAYCQIYTFNHGWEHPSDYLDHLFFSGILWLSLGKRRVALTMLVLLATLNHQTAAFAGFIWFFLFALDFAPLRVRWAEAAYAAALSAGSYGLSNVVRLAMGGRGRDGYGTDGRRTLVDLLEFLRHPQPYGWPVLMVAMVAPLVIWLWSNRAGITDQIQRLLWAAAAILAVSSAITPLEELRSAFLVPLVVVGYAAVAADVNAGGAAAQA